MQSIVKNEALGTWTILIESANGWCSQCWPTTELHDVIGTATWMRPQEQRAPSQLHQAQRGKRR